MTRDEALKIINDARSNNTIANLRGADLSGADGNFCTGSFRLHHGIAAGGYICIGCERHTYQEWLDNIETIGADNGYTPTEVAHYRAWCELAVKVLTETEETQS